MLLGGGPRRSGPPSTMPCPWRSTPRGCCSGAAAACRLCIAYSLLMGSSPWAVQARGCLLWPTMAPAVSLAPHGFAHRRGTSGCCRGKLGCVFQCCWCSVMVHGGHAGRSDPAPTNPKLALSWAVPAVKKNDAHACAWGAGGAPCAAGPTSFLKLVANPHALEDKLEGFYRASDVGQRS